MVVELGEDNLGRDILPIAGVARLLALGVELATRDIARAGITTLNHKVLDDAVEQKRVEVVLLDKLHKIIAVAGGKIAELQNDVASRSLHLHTAGLAHFGLRATSHHSGSHYKSQKYLSHFEF